eukprot:g1764.t1
MTLHRGHLNVTITTLNRGVAPFVYEKRASGYYPYAVSSVKPRTSATRIYSHSEGFSIKTTTSPSPAILSETRENHMDEKFSWFKNWWAVQLVDNLKTDRPNKVTLLGKDFIVWKGHGGDWIAMDDQCPHRMAPLSEGRIEKDGNLLCSYHAWRFNESGKCVRIPHAEDEKAHTVACNSSRSSTRGALLWIWPDNSVSAFSDSENVPVPIDNDFADYAERLSSQGSNRPYFRYLPYSFDVLMENLCDPSHFIVSHHSLGPSISRYNARPLHGKLVPGMHHLPATAAFQSNPQDSLSKWSQVEFRKPGTVVYFSGKSEDKNEPSLITFLTAAPISSGKSMVVAMGVQGKLKDQPMKLSPSQVFLNPLLTLFLHLKIQNPLFDGDSVFLSVQDRKIKTKGLNFKASKEYYVPTSADLLVMAFRKWFETEGEYGAVYGGDKMPLNEIKLAKHEMLNRYEQHTKHCSTCSRYLKRLEFAIKALKFISTGALFIGSLILIRAMDTVVIDWKTVLKNIALWTAITITILFAFVGNYLEKNIRPMFYFEDWVHADKN